MPRAGRVLGDVSARTRFFLTEILPELQGGERRGSGQGGRRTQQRAGWPGCEEHDGQGRGERTRRDAKPSFAVNASSDSTPSFSTFAVPADSASDYVRITYILTTALTRPFSSPGQTQSHPPPVSCPPSSAAHRASACAREETSQHAVGTPRTRPGTWTTKSTP